MLGLPNPGGKDVAVFVGDGARVTGCTVGGTGVAVRVSAADGFEDGSVPSCAGSAVVQADRTKQVSVVRIRMAFFISLAFVY